MPEALSEAERAADSRHGEARTYSWRETPVEIEVRVPLPVGTKRSQLSITLHDEASGANLWRTEIETAGGRDEFAERAVIRVQPAFWPEPLLAGVLTGSVDPHQSSYELTSTSGNDGGDAWDCLQLVLRKAEGSGGWWGRVVEDELAHDGSVAAAQAAAAAAAGRALPSGAAELVQLMASAPDDGSLQLACASACAALADAGGMTELLAAKALSQLSASMRAHLDAPELQAAGCAVLARAPLASCSAAVARTVSESRLIPAATGAMLRWPAHPLVQLDGARALLTVAAGGEAFHSQLVEAQAVPLLCSCMVASCASSRPVCDVACEALGWLARGGRKTQLAMLQQGAPASLLAAVASTVACYEWRRRCALVVLSLAGTSDVAILKELLAAGLLPALTQLLGHAVEAADEEMAMLVGHAFGGLSWRASSASLRASIRPELVEARSAEAMVAAAEAFPARPALRIATVKLLGEVSTLQPPCNRPRSCWASRRRSPAASPPHEPSPHTSRVHLPICGR